MKTILIPYNQKREKELISMGIEFEIIDFMIAVYNFNETHSKEDFIELLDNL